MAVIGSSQLTAETANNIRTLLVESSTNHDTVTQQQLSEKQDARRLDELRQIFAGLIHRGELTWNCHLHKKQLLGQDNNNAESSMNVDKAKKKWSKWLQEQHKIFIDQLCERVRRSKKYALRILMGVIATSVTRDPDLLRVHQFEKQFYHETPLKTGLMRTFLDTLCECGTDPNIVVVDYESLVNLFIQEFVKPYKDIQLVTLDVLKKIAQTSSEDIVKLDAKVESANYDSLKLKQEHLIFILERIPSLLDITQEHLDELDREKSILLFNPPIQQRKETESDKEKDNLSDDDSNTDESDDEDETSSATEQRKSGTTTIESKKTKTKKKKLSSVAEKCFVLSKQKLALEQAWLATLPCTSFISPSVHKRVLVYLPSKILPVVNHPLQFAQYFTTAYEQQRRRKVSPFEKDEQQQQQLSFASSATACLALDGLFCLMTKHGLEYPEFFASLYALVEPNVFYSKHRTKFLSLLSRCMMSSQMLPAFLVAAMCKRLCRCALSAPPSGALFALALTGNLLRQHKACRCLVHRGVPKDGGDGAIEDVFDPNAQVPLHSRAIESSLWELGALEKHYHPDVSTMAKACGLEDDRSSTLYDMEDFIAHTYSSMFEREQNANGHFTNLGTKDNDDNNPAKKKKRKLKSVPVTFTEPQGLFAKNEVFSSAIEMF